MTNKTSNEQICIRKEHINDFVIDQKDCFKAKKQKFILLIINSLETNILSEGLLKKISIDNFEHESYYLAIFPRGIYDFLIAIEDFFDQKLVDFKSEIDITKSTNQKIAKLITYRLMNIGITQFVFKNIVNCYKNYDLKLIELRLKTCYSTSNFMWHLTGDKSLDFNFYTKRGILIKIYLNSIKRYILDNSTDNLETKEHISQIIESTTSFLGSIKKINIFRKKFLVDR